MMANACSMCLLVCVLLWSEVSQTSASMPPNGFFGRSPRRGGRRGPKMTYPEVNTKNMTLKAESAPLGSKVVEQFHVQTDIRFRFATTTMTSLVRNMAGQDQEVGFDVTLPKDAFIMDFAMTIDGKRYDGEVKEKTEAKQQYQAAVDRGQSAGLVRQAAREANVFQVSVNVASGTAVNFTLSYQELLKRKRGIYEYELHVKPGQPVADFRVDVNIQEKQNLKFVRTPELRKDALITNEIEAENELTVIERPDPKTAHVTFEPSEQQQGEAGVDGKFVVQYDTEHGPEGDVLVVDGYFVHFFSPKLPPMPKDIIFVLDKSGSMSGKKMAQLKEAMTVILGDLQDQDRFNIITFSTQVTKWKPGLVTASTPNVREAKTYTQTIIADGMTNINQALLTATKDFYDVEESKGRASIIFFLTDGEPTEDVRDPKIIAKNVRQANEKNAAILSLAFGEGADFGGLKTISAQNSGFARKIYEAADSALQVASLYSEVSSVVMTNMSVSYLPDAVDEFTLTESEFPVVYNGTEIVICGLMPRVEAGHPFRAEITGVKNSGSVDLVFEEEDMTNLVIDIGVGGGTNNFVIDVVDDIDVGGDDGVTVSTTEAPARDYAGLLERMWAYVTIKQLLKDLDRHSDDEKKSEQLKKEIIKTSLKYRLVTPLTSMVVTKPDSDQKTQASLEDAHTPERDAMYSSHAVRQSSKMYRRKQHSFMAPSYHPGKMAGLPGLSHGPVHHYPMPSLTVTMPTLATMPTYALVTRKLPPITPPTPPPAPSRDQVLLGLVVVQKLGSNVMSKACALMKKMGSENYTLFDDNETSMSMKTQCSDKCKKVEVESLEIRHPKFGVTTVTFSSDRNWNITSATQSKKSFKIIKKKGKVVIKGPNNLMVHIKRKNAKKMDKYIIYVTLEPKDKFNGLIDSMFKPRKGNQKAKGICKREKKSYAQLIASQVNGKQLRKYRKK